MITLTTNINIKSLYGDMNYIVKYNELNDYIDNNNVTIIQNDINNQINIKINNLSDIKSLIRLDTYWMNFDQKSNITLHYLPEKIDLSSIKLLFPNFSVDTYESGIKYALTISTYIDNTLIFLGSYLIDRLNALACSPIERYLDNNYYEYIEVPIINPYNIIYSDEWADFRKYICGEPEALNNTGTIINISLYPIISSDDIYIMKDNYTGALNGLNLYKDKADDFLNLLLDFVENQDEYPYFKTQLVYNHTYNNLLEYLKETYNFFELREISYIFTIRDKNDMYKKIVKTYKSDFPEIVNFNKYDKSYKDINNWDLNIILQFDNILPQELNFDDQLVFENWEGWHEGITIDITLHIVGNTLNDNQLISCGLEVPSNYLYFTKDILKYFIFDDNIININKVDLKNMEKEHIIEPLIINAINKIENKIIQIDKPEDVKSNITYPVFYKSYDVNNIILHPNVDKENICINLDSYKSKVKTFGLKLKDDENTIIFTEIGRISQGVIFQIIDNQLPKTNEGLYYIINENNELVTMGNYKYIK